MTIHEKIKYIREQKKMNQSEMAELLQVTQATVSYMETGTMEPSFSVIYILVNKLRVNPYFLIANEQTVFDSQKKYSNRAKRDQALVNLNKAIDDISKISL